MSEWRSGTLQEIAAPIERPFAMGPFGSRIKKENYRDSGVPVIRGGNLQGVRYNDAGYVYLGEDKADELSASIAEPGDVVFVAQGGIGQVGLVPSDGKFDRFILSQNLMKVTIDPARADPAFVFYYFRSRLGQHEILSYANPTGVPCISRPLTSLKSFRLPLPPVNVQRSIAHILGTLDDKIELNRRMNRTLGAIARAIFKSWFIDFDPVIDNALLNGKPIPDEFAERAMNRREVLARGDGDEGVASYRHLFPDSFQDSPLGKIPNGWEIVELNNLLKLNRESIKPQECSTEEFDHYSIPAYDSGSPVREVGHEIRSSKHQVPSSAVLISKLNPHIPRVWFPNVAEERRSICSTEFLVCTPQEGISREYLYSLLSSSAFLDQFAQMVTGTTGSHQRVRPKAFTAMKVVNPSPELLATFTRSTEPLFARCASAAAESGDLATTRDVLLPRLLSGSLRVGSSRLAEVLSDEA